MNGYQAPIRVIYARKGTLEVDKQNERILLHIYDAHYEERDEADVNDLRLMRYGISLKEGVLPISLQGLIDKAKNNRRPNELTLGQLRYTLEQQQGKEKLRQRTILRTERMKRSSTALPFVTVFALGS